MMMPNVFKVDNLQRWHTIKNLTDKQTIQNNVNNEFNNPFNTHRVYLQPGDHLHSNNTNTSIQLIIHNGIAFNKGNHGRLLSHFNQ